MAAEQKDRVIQEHNEPGSSALAAQVVAQLTERKLTVAVAESLTGGLLAATFVQVPGASSVFLGGVVAYNTELKRSVLHVDADLLAARGAVDPAVARQMAHNVRSVLAVDGAPAAIGMATTGVAGPDGQDGHAPGEVYVGISFGEHDTVRRLHLRGSRDFIRTQVVTECLSALRLLLQDNDS
ncbi:MAG TPA: CinA family protein [Glaciihabitans sp.]|nr:CinA family protein [Glaciihabitans sp.]